MKLLICMITSFIFSASYSQTFTLKSKDLGGQATMKNVFNGFGCEGKNISPQLFWENAPKGTKSFALIIHDETAPTESGWWHWLVFDIPLDINVLVSDAGNVSKNLAPIGAVQSITDYGSYGYGGPCPPIGHGIHKYTVTLFALKLEKLGLDKNTNAAIVGFNLNQNAIEKASIVFYYSR